MKKLIKVVYSRVAEKDLRKLPKKTASRVLLKIVENTNQPDPLSRAKALTGRFSGAHRYRVGDYRVVFIIDELGNLVVFTVMQIKHRKDIYR